MADRRARSIVIGVGNEYRRDDGFGPFVIVELERLRQGGEVPRDVDLRGCDGEPTRLIDLWTGADLAVVVDVARADATRAGEWLELVLSDDDHLPGEMTVSSHGIGLGSTVELGRALGRLPRRLVVLAAIGRDFGFGVGLCRPLADAVHPVAGRVRRWLSRECRAGDATAVGP